MKIQLVNTLSNRVFAKGIVQATSTETGLRSGSTSTDGIAIIGPLLLGEKISVQLSVKGLFVLYGTNLWSLLLTL